MAAHWVYLSVIHFTSIVLLANVNNYCHCSIVGDVRLGEAIEDVNSQVWLTVSPKVEKVWATGVKRLYYERQLEINWKHVPVYNKDSNVYEETMWACLLLLPLYRIGNQINSSDDFVVEKVPITASTARKGRYRTSFIQNNSVLRDDHLTSDCVGDYTVVLIDASDKVFAKNCIRAQPNWMSDNWDYIASSALKDVFIPGTHNSGAYQIGYKSHAAAIVDNYLYCQDEPVYRQLLYGNRYLDLRVGYLDRRDEKLWIVHGSWTTSNTLRKVLEDVAKFIRNTEKEVVIIDFHRFEQGFENHPTDEAINYRNRVRHQEVKQLIESILGEYIYRSVDHSEYRTKLSEIINAGKRVIIGYAENNHIRDAKYFRAVRHLWANAQSVNALESYLNRMVCLRPGFEATAAMAQMTADGFSTVFNKFEGGIRKMAQDVNWIVTEWFDERWSRCVNIVATDYFLGTNMIEVAIRANRRRYRAAQPSFAMWTPHNHFSHS